MNSVLRWCRLTQWYLGRVMWPQQKWGQRSFRGHWPFGFKFMEKWSLHPYTVTMMVELHFWPQRMWGQRSFNNKDNNNKYIFVKRKKHLQYLDALNTTENEYTTDYIWKELLKRCVFRLLLNWAILGDCWIFSGHAFHSIGVVTANARSP